MSEAPQTFPFYRLTGTHRAIGRQFGEACVGLIHTHREAATARRRQCDGVSSAQTLRAAARFRDYVIEYAPFFDEEIQGVAEGAGLSLDDAYLLQLRAELSSPSVLRAFAETAECTTFAALAEATSDGVPLVGQNADLPALYQGIGVVLEIVPDDMPAVLMLTPAGQVSYIGINDCGLGIFANFLTCDDWRVGFPRYLLSRLGLTCETADDAIAAMRAVPRASSRNMLLLDAHGVAADLETTPLRDARLDPANGLLAHSNHYVAEALHDAERVTGAQLANSRIRLARMNALLAERRGQLNAEVMETLMRDRADYPDALCRMPGDNADSDIITFASVIAAPTRGEMRVAVGPPNTHPYRRYAFTGVAAATAVGGA